MTEPRDGFLYSMWRFVPVCRADYFIVSLRRLVILFISVLSAPDFSFSAFVGEFLIYKIRFILSSFGSLSLVENWFVVELRCSDLLINV